MLLSVLLRPFLGRRLSLCWFALAAGWLPAAPALRPIPPSQRARQRP